MAWHHMGWKPSFFSEIESFPCAVLQHHYPEVPLHGDFTTIGELDYEPIDLLVGGTPCQSFSVAGLRRGMADERGNLALEFLKLAQRTRPKWVVWENVPGVLSSNKGRDFGAFLGGLGEVGYGFAYRVLNAQYFGVPQRRRRVFVVGYLGDWRPPAAVLFERHSLQGHPAPSREAGKETSGRIGKCAEGECWPKSIAPTLNAAFGDKLGLEDQHALSGAGLFVPEANNKDYLCMASGQANAEILKNTSPTLTAISPERPIISCSEVSPPVTASGPPFSRPGNERIEAEALVAFGWQNSSSQGDSVSETVVPTLDTSKTPAVALCENQRGELRENSVTNALAAQGGKPGQGYAAARVGTQVRRLTPVECERLQGFPDDFTKIPYRNKPADKCPDGPRYKAMGNSMAVPVMKWIGERIQMVEDVLNGA